MDRLRHKIEKLDKQIDNLEKLIKLKGKVRNDSSNAGGLIPPLQELKKRLTEIKHKKKLEEEKLALILEKQNEYEEDLDLVLHKNGRRTRSFKNRSDRWFENRPASTCSNVNYSQSTNFDGASKSGSKSSQGLKKPSPGFMVRFRLSTAYRAIWRQEVEMSYPPIKPSFYGEITKTLQSRKRDSSSTRFYEPYRLNKRHSSLSSQTSQSPTKDNMKLPQKKHTNFVGLNDNPNMSPLEKYYRHGSIHNTETVQATDTRIQSEHNQNKEKIPEDPKVVETYSSHGSVSVNDPLKCSSPTFSVLSHDDVQSVGKWSNISRSSSLQKNTSLRSRSNSRCSEVAVSETENAPFGHDCDKLYFIQAPPVSRASSMTTDRRDKNRSRFSDDGADQSDPCRYIYRLVNCRRITDPSRIITRRENKGVAGTIHIFDGHLEGGGVDPDTECYFCKEEPEGRINRWMTSIESGNTKGIYSTKLYNPAYDVKPCSKSKRRARKKAVPLHVTHKGIHGNCDRITRLSSLLNHL